MTGAIEAADQLVGIIDREGLCAASAADAPRMRSMILNVINTAVAAEREACAKTLEDLPAFPADVEHSPMNSLERLWYQMMRERGAVAIRARGQT
jgi:hypothetical protein